MRVLHPSRGARLSGKPMHGIEESLKLKRTLLLSILAVVPAALMPLAAIGQVAPDRDSKPDKAEPSYKYEVFAGYGYTSLNQVNQSRSGLQGPDVTVTRNWGKYFAITADGAYYKYAYESGNPGTPSVQAVLFGPVIHTPIAGRFSGFGHVLLGGEHLAGEDVTPKVSFAAGAGGGLEYQLSPRLALRAAGDDVFSSFSVTGNTSALSYSPHRTWSSRAAFGLVYRF